MNVTPMLLAVAIAGGIPEMHAPAGRQAPQTISAEDHALLLRSRFERWLDDHRATLTARQVSAVREAIEQVTPELFRAPREPGAIQRQLETSEKLYCALGSELAYSFANDKTPAPPVARTWTQAVHTWISWVAECVVK